MYYATKFCTTVFIACPSVFLDSNSRINGRTLAFFPLRVFLSNFVCPLLTAGYYGRYDDLHSACESFDESYIFWAHRNNGGPHGEFFLIFEIFTLFPTRPSKQFPRKRQMVRSWSFFEFCAAMEFVQNEMCFLRVHEFTFLTRLVRLPVEVDNLDWHLKKVWIISMMSVEILAE